MSDDHTFRTLVVVLLCVGSAIRGYYLVSSERRSRSRRVREESRLSMTLQALFYSVGAGLVITYVAYPQLIAWASLPLPVWVRVMGAVLGVLSSVLLAWVHRSLDLNCSFVLCIREGHTLVTHGPYACIRHPMYAAWYLLHCSLFLVSSNWLLGLYLIGVYTIPITLRMNEEEAMLLDTFGNDYLEYMKKTGRLLPRLRMGSNHGG